MAVGRGQSGQLLHDPGLLGEGRSAMVHRYLDEHTGQLVEVVFEHDAVPAAAAHMADLLPVVGQLHQLQPAGPQLSGRSTAWQPQQQGLDATGLPSRLMPGISRALTSNAVDTIRSSPQGMPLLQGLQQPQQPQQHLQPHATRLMADAVAAPLNLLPSAIPVVDVSVQRHEAAQVGAVTAGFTAAALSDAALLPLPELTLARGATGAVGADAPGLFAVTRERADAAVPLDTSASDVDTKR